MYSKKIFQNQQKSIYAEVSFFFFFYKLPVQNFIEKESGTGVFQTLLNVVPFYVNIQCFSWNFKSKRASTCFFFNFLSQQYFNDETSCLEIPKVATKRQRYFLLDYLRRSSSFTELYRQRNFTNFSGMLLQHGFKSNFFAESLLVAASKTCEHIHRLNKRDSISLVFKEILK